MLDVAKGLLDHAATHRLRDRADAACRRWAREAAAAGELRGLVDEDVVLRFERCALVFDSASVSHPFVETRLGVHTRGAGSGRDGRRVGHYRLITTLDGADEDDYFVLEPPAAD